ncbi:hypothetical protein [Candidatus Stoquefichus sp. SB1]|uniref:hypothetical protein n=1 Tax=Candidatus Stoquefichus sp. SB1 TaxID=1658109 RepID=UPI00067F3890|nr:hypothetical protein [Candidatus Stoquefichus sp. SB1]
MAMKFKISNETEVNIGLTFAKLYKLKLDSKTQKDYEKFNVIFNRGAKDVFDYLYIIYVAYLCENENKQYEFNDFIENVDYFDMDYIIRTVNALSSSKKK